MLNTKNQLNSKDITGIINKKFPNIEKSFKKEKTMETKIKNYIKNKKTKTLNLQEIYQIMKLPYNPTNDKKIYNVMEKLEQEKYIEHLKTSKRNNCGCFEKYKILKQNEGSQNTIKKELLGLNKKIKIDYYLKHLNEYEKDKEIILPINKFFKEIEKQNTPIHELTVNERSYQLYKNEKRLKENEDTLKKLGLEFKDLYAFDTYEPFFYYINTAYNPKNKKRTILIVENKDTFWTIVKTVQQLKLDEFYIIIYGEGKKIINSFLFVQELKIGYEDIILYFGDIDYEGINIYESIKEKYCNYHISAYKIGYEALIDLEDKPSSIRTAQRINLKKIERFLDEFSPKYQEKLKIIFKQNKYIPQEVFNLEVANAIFRSTYIDKKVYL